MRRACGILDKFWSSAKWDLGFSTLQRSLSVMLGLFDKSSWVILPHSWSLEMTTYKSAEVKVRKGPKSTTTSLTSAAHRRLGTAGEGFNSSTPAISQSFFFNVFWTPGITKASDIGARSMSDCPRAVSMSFSEADCLKVIVSEVLSSDYSGWVAPISGPWYMSVSAVLSENVPCQRLTGQVSLNTATSSSGKDSRHSTRSRKSCWIFSSSLS